MAETLSQAEIDALRDAVRSGKIEDVSQAKQPATSTREYKVVGYDFRKPQLLSAENLLMLQTMHQALAKNIQGLLFSMFKITADSTLSAMDQVSYSEFMLSLETPTYLLGLQAEPEFGPIGFELSPPLGAQILEMLLGGDGDIEEDGQHREFSPLEMDIIRAWIDRAMEEIQLAWSNLQPFELTVTSAGSTPDQIQVVPGDTPCICAGIDIKIHNHESRIHICYPFSTLQDIFQKSEVEQDVGRRSEMRKATLKAIQQVPVESGVELGRATILAKQLSELQVGDIIKLDNQAANELQFYIGDTPVGSGMVGSRQGRLAIRLQNMKNAQKRNTAKQPSPPAAGSAVPKPQPPKPTKG